MEKGPDAKLESDLAQVADAFGTGGPAAAAQAALEKALPLQNSQVRVIVEAGAAGTAEAADAITALGGQVEKTRGELAQALLPVSALEALAADGNVGFVRLPYRRVPLVTGQGVALINADDWHAAGFTGSGVKVAILDLGFAGYAGLLGSELPASVITHSCSGDVTGGGEPHGTAVAEIVHEVAPDAQLYLVNFNTDLEYAECVDWMVAQGVGVINHSVGWFGSGPGDGTGPINDVAAGAVSAGVFWTNAAGNQARRHWSDAWQDNDANDWLNFSGADEGNDITVSAGQTVIAILKWNDPFGASCNNYDLYLKRTNGASVAFSLNPQICSQDPVEVLSYTSSTSATYSLQIHRTNADGTANFHLYTFRHDLEYQEAAGSVVEPADNPGVLTAGAVAWSSPSTIEYFSSRGPTDDGRIKPNLVGPDGVSSFTYGSFYGTSASSPHAAGAAALVLQANPGWTPAQAISFLEGRAVDLGSAGPDNVYGAGRLDLGSPGATTTPTPTKTATATPTATPTGTATPTQTPIPDSDGDGVLDGLDNCPSVPNPDQLNTDSALVPNGADIASDFRANPDKDAQGDACDPDDDSDGPDGNDGLYEDTEEAAGCGYGPTDPLKKDTDGDTAIDGYECKMDKDPDNPGQRAYCSSATDTDGDGITDCVEEMGYGTSPLSTDTDGDSSGNDGCQDDKQIVDVNRDGLANILDVMAVALIALTPGPFDPVSERAADIDKNGVNNVLDVSVAALNSTLVQPHTTC
jgi:subtilisin family serine protease